MDAEFWRERWEAGRIGFHEGQPNRFLTAHLAALSLSEGSRVFVPLCGKTLAIGWLLARGNRVAGVELSELAVEQLFAELGLAPDVADAGALTRYGGPGIEIFVGDFFSLGAATLGPSTRSSTVPL